ncbi:hypothetical protein HLY00_240 [Mycolicibacterium hippocampi]|uniref:PE-PPE domain-containing protein n=2 Tax=Mycobacteriaceae TaxID=1762 RepID=A0A850PKY7_9MYCO|nr:hypothetical protein [Mycolicibacterium hippocampi]
MRPVLKPLAMGSAALVGASLIVAAPATPALTPPLPEEAKAQFSDVAVRLAANSIANIPTNLYRILMDSQKNQLDGLNAASESLEGSGNWWIYTPTNVLGWDHMDYAKAIGFTKLFTPIPEVAQAQADQLNAIMSRNFPMTQNCTGTPGPCADPFYFTAYFTTPPWEALFGYEYTFGDVFNTLDPSIEMPWSNQTVTYDPFGPGKALWEALTKDPVEGWAPERTYLLDQMEASERFWKAVYNSFNPFVEGTYCLPCQLLGVKGAPSSLPVASIFGNFYTYLDFGQEFTDQDWVGPHPEVPKPPTVKTLSLWTPEAWERIGRDAEVYFNWVFKGGPMPQTELEEPSVYPEVPDNTPPIPQGLAADLPPKVISVKGTELWPIDDALNGSVCDGSLGDCENLEYIRFLQEFSIRNGLQQLTAALADPGSGPATVFGYSEGSVIASRWLSNYSKALAKAQAEGGPTADVEGSPDRDDLHFILTGNPNRKYGGTRPAWYIERATPSDTKYTVLDVAREYDGAADWPDDPFNLLAVANAISGYFVVHPYYDEVDLENDEKTVFQEGNTTYVLVRTENLPMLQSLRAIGLNDFADELQSYLKPIIDRAYDRDYPGVIADPDAAQEAVDRAKAGLPPEEATADTLTLVANNEDASADSSDDTKKVTETAERKTNSLFSLDLPKDLENESDEVSTSSEVDGTLGDYDEGEPGGEQSPEEPTTETGTEGDSTDGSEESETAETPRKRFADPFKPFGSSKQRVLDSTESTKGESVGGETTKNNADTSKSPSNDPKGSNSDSKSSERDSKKDSNSDSKSSERDSKRDAA